jgi:3-oxoadipate enol-lactonase
MTRATRATRAVAVHHVVDGREDAPALVLSNSLGTTLAVWDRQIPALAPSFRVVRYDLRGHGSSPVPPGPYDIEDLGADVLGLLDRLGLNRAHLCGLSIGGMIAMWLAANAPDRVDRLVVCCSSPRFEPADMWRGRAATVRAKGSTAVADTVVARWFTPGFAARSPRLIARMRAMIAGTPSEGYASCCDLLERTDLFAILPAIQAPTLAIAGADDPVAPPSKADLIAGAIPDCRVTVVEPAAHLANVERPDAVSALILEHLLDGPRRTRDR